MDNKLYLPISLIFSALILSGTIFLVGGSVNDNLSGLSVLGTSVPTVTALSGDTGTTAPAPAPTPAPSPTLNLEELADEDKILGDPNAPITIVEFSDFECPFCGRFYSQTLGQLKEEYIDTGKVKLIYRDFPLSFHPQAQPAAEAAECANEQGKFFEFHDLIFENQSLLGPATYSQWAADLGLDVEQFDSCLDDGKYRAEVQADFAAGQAAGVSGTPTFFINGQKIVGAQPFSVFKQIIDAELAQ